MGGAVLYRNCVDLVRGPRRVARPQNAEHHWQEYEAVEQPVNHHAEEQLEFIPKMLLFCFLTHAKNHN